MNLTLNAATLITILVTLIISLSIHEAMHAFASYKLGDTTAYEMGRLSFNPLHHIDPFATILLPLITLLLFGVPLLAAKPVPFNPNRVKYHEYGAAIVGLAGPLSNLVLAVIGALLMHAVAGSGTLVDMLSIFVTINVAVFVFNMIPIPPLDGSRLLYAFAPEPVQEIMARMERYGFFIVFALVLAVPGFSTLLIFLNNAILRFLP